MGKRNGHQSKIEQLSTLRDIRDLPPGTIPPEVQAAMAESSGPTVEQRVQRFNDLLVAAQNETGIVLAIVPEQPAPGFVTMKIQAVPRENIRG